ncbi:MAG: metal-dependent transcriptional regulator [Clostridiales bacterium]|nr:metal-dependent transcriptional regulator [Clostridiales bacterium]
MQIKESAENYLETILMIHNKKGYCRGIDICNEMGFSKPSVSVYMKHLREDNYISVDNSGNISLTDKGREIAERIYERHNVIAGFLMQLGTSEANAYHDSCKIEHDISEESFQLIKKSYYENLKKS